MRLSLMRNPRSMSRGSSAFDKRRPRTDLCEWCHRVEHAISPTVWSLYNPNQSLHQTRLTAEEVAELKILQRVGPPMTLMVTWLVKDDFVQRLVKHQVPPSAL